VKQSFLTTGKSTTSLLFALCALLSGCSARQPAEPELPEAVLQARIQGIYDAPIPLTNGRYVGPAFVQGGTSRPTVTLLQDRVATGDLDSWRPASRDVSISGAGAHDYAVLLAESSGGSGSFIYLALLRLQGGELVNHATTLLGDRVDVTSLTIVDGEIRASMLIHGTDDPVCCPSVRAQRSWQLIGDEISEVTEFGGHLVYGHEAREFIPCSEQRALWVVDGTGGDMPAAYRTLALEPYTPIYVEVRGATGPTPDAEFARSYRRQLRITQLMHAGRESAGCPLPDRLTHRPQQQ
jgi:hypothetical protein